MLIPLILLAPFAALAVPISPKLNWAYVLDIFRFTQFSVR